MEKIAGFAEVNGTTLYYEVKGEGFPLVFVHGHLVDRRMWDDQWDVFAQNYKVIRYDARGFGKSDLPDKPYFPAEDLRALLMFLNIKKAVVIGLSMGGGVNIDFTLEYPDMVSALVLAAPSLGGYNYSGEELPGKAAAFFSTAKEKGALEAVQWFLEEPFWSYTIPSDPGVRGKFETLMKENIQIFDWNQAFLQLAHPPAALRLSEIKVPTLVAAADGDYYENLKVTELLEAEIKGAKRVVMKDTGHMLNMEKPAQFNKILQDFLVRGKE